MLDTSAEEEESRSLLVLVHAQDATSVLFVSFNHDKEGNKWNDPKEIEIDYDRQKYHTSLYKDKLIEQVRQKY